MMPGDECADDLGVVASRRRPFVLIADEHSLDCGEGVDLIVEDGDDIVIDVIFLDLSRLIENYV